MDEPISSLSYDLDPAPIPPKRSPTPWVWVIVTLLAALIGAVALIITGNMDYNSGRRDGVAAAETALAPTISHLETQVVGSGTLVASNQATREENLPANTATPSQNPTSPAGARLEGTLTDRSYNPIAGTVVGIRGGPQAVTDAKGVFVINGVAAGDQQIEVTSPSGKGSLTLNISIDPTTENKIQILYDPATESIGLLAILAPVNGTFIEVEANKAYYLEVTGKCTGLSKLYSGSFNIWLIVDPGKGESLWIQSMPALIDPTNETWTGKAWLGSEQNPPQNGQEWKITAVSVDSSLDIGSIGNTPSLTQLPPHIQSNVVKIETRVK